MPALNATRALAATATPALIACLIAVSLQPTVAAADIATGSGQEATTAQFRAMESALRGHLHGRCFLLRAATLVSNEDPRWAVVLSGAQGGQRCDGGDASVHFYLSRKSAHVNRWSYRYSEFQVGGSGNPAPCGPMTVASDIRC